MRRINPMEAVVHVLEDETDRLCLAAEAPQHRRVRVSPVVELLDRALDALLERGTDPGLGVDDPRDGLQCHPGQCGDVLHRRTASSSRRSI